jgi:membrane protease YdiL (CAAX protease family)
MKSLSNSRRELLAILICQYVAWTAWLIFVKYFYNDGASYDNPYRALSRVLILLLPAIFFIYTNKEINFELKENIVRGLKYGLIASLLITVYYLLVGNRFGDLNLDRSIWVWINFVIFSPIAEEMMYRVVVMKTLSGFKSTFFIVITSSLLFVAYHIPQWVFSVEVLSVQEILVNAITIFIYGIIFALLYHKSKSIFGSLIPHIVNNFLFLG